MHDLIYKLESILFVANKPTPTAVLAKLANSAPEETELALRELASQRKDSGIVVMEANGQWQLGTHPQNVELVKAYLTTDLREKLTDATVEVLGIIAYRQPISKTEIEAIRGVNCQYSIRQLLMRGLIEKVSNPSDSRSNYYQVTTEFLQHMGLQSVGELPEFEKLTSSIKLPETPQTKTESADITPEQPATPVESRNYQDPVGANFVPSTPEQTPAEPTTPAQPDPISFDMEDLDEELDDDDDEEEV